MSKVKMTGTGRRGGRRPVTVWLGGDGWYVDAGSYASGPWSSEAEALGKAEEIAGRPSMAEACR